MRRRLFGIVLAAGEGRRMGGPKARLVRGGRSLLDAHACRMHECGALATALVVRPAVLAALEPSERPPGGWLVPATTESQAESLGIGLRAVDARVRLEAEDLLLVSPVDLLPPALTTVRALLDAMTGGASAATPTCRGRGGHPVVATFDLVRSYLSSGKTPLRETLRAAGDARRRIDVEDDAVLGDFDTPTEWARAQRG
jgi:CTP:molybdopterin cytidylyltransferase MocA